MKINLKTAVSRLFPNHSFEMIYIEAIANALDAEATKITIDVNYKDGKFNSFKILDNGVGIDDSRYQRFSNLMDAKDSSHKGQGRLVYLHYFNNVSFESVYRENNGLVKINFEFNYDFDESSCRKQKVLEDKTGTKISFKNYSKDKVGKKEYLNAISIKETILSEFLPALHKIKESDRNIEIYINSMVDGTSTSDNISTKDIPDFQHLELTQDELAKFSPQLSKKISQDLFREPLSLYYYVNNTSKEPSIVTSFAIDNRAIKVSIIDKENYINGIEAIFFMYSKSFDGEVDPTRQELTIAKNDLKEIKKIFKVKIQEIFSENIPEFQKHQKNEKEFLKDKYPHLIGYISEEDVGFNSKKEILFDARDKFFNDQQEILEKDHLTNEDYRKALDISSRNLAEYIIFRQKQIEKLKDIKKNEREEIIHDVICPRKNEDDQSSLNIFRNNAWILDDRFMSFYSSFSDITLSKISELKIFGEKSSSKKRPDFLLLFSRPINESDVKEIDVVVFEFKRLNIDTHDRLKAASELRNYANELKKVLYTEGKTIGRIWLYALVNMDDEFKDELMIDDFKSRFSPQGEIWYKYYENLSLEISFFDFDTLISDANIRNETFIRILKNDFSDS